MVSDFTKNNNPRFLYLAAMHRKFPDWVVSEPIPTAPAFEKLASAAFADPKRRLLPISDKLSTFYSAIDMFANLPGYDESAADLIKDACQHFGISEEVAPYAEFFADRFEAKGDAKVKAASQTGRYAINETINGQEYRLLPLNDGEDVRSSSNDLAKMAAENRIHYLTMIPAAQEIVKAAEDLGVVHKLQPAIHSMGRARFPDVDNAIKLMEGREKVAFNTQQKTKGDNLSIEVIRDNYQEVMDSFKDGSASPEQCVEKLAAIDDACGLRYRYGQWAMSHPMPHEIVFSGPLVEEAEKQAKLNVMVKDVLIPLEAVKNIGAMDLSFKLTKEASDSLFKVLDTDDAKDISMAVAHWEEDDQKTLLRMAAAAN